jgi:hypothetical protein
MIWQDTIDRLHLSKTTYKDLTNGHICKVIDIKTFLANQKRRNSILHSERQTDEILQATNSYINISRLVIGSDVVIPFSLFALSQEAKDYLRLNGIVDSTTLLTMAACNRWQNLKPECPDMWTYLDNSCKTSCLQLKDAYLFKNSLNSVKDLLIFNAFKTKLLPYDSEAMVAVFYVAYRDRLPCIERLKGQLLLNINRSFNSIETVKPIMLALNSILMRPLPPMLSESQMKELLKRGKLPYLESSSDLYANTLGYYRRVRSRTSFIFQDFSSMEDVILKTQIFSGVLEYDNYVKDGEYDTAIRNLVIRGSLIDLGGKTLYTKDYLNDIGISNEQISESSKIIKNLFSEKMYVSLGMLRDSLQNNAVLSFSQSDQYLLSLVRGTMERVWEMRFADERRLYFSSHAYRPRSSFLEYVMIGKDSISLLNLKDEVEEEYQVLYDESEIVYDVKATKFFYSEQTEKIYSSKKQFLKEIFGNE